MTNKFWLLILILLGIGVYPISGQNPQQLESVPIDPELRIGKLDNGLTYYIKRNVKPAKQAEFYIFSNVGAIQEEDQQVGLAHFLEHMAFGGTKNFPNKSLINYLESIGVKFGTNLNASTGVEQTTYMISGVPLLREGIIDTALLALHDWAYYITLDHQKIDRERGVIIEEFRQGNNASRRTREKALPVLFNHSRYSYRNIIGTVENLKNFEYQELEDFYHRWYQPKNQAIIVVGDIDVDQIESKIKMLMGTIPAAVNPERKVFQKIEDNEEPLIDVITDPELTMADATIYIKTPPMMRQFNDKIVALKLQASIRMTTYMLGKRLQEASHKEGSGLISSGVDFGALTTGCDVLMGKAIAQEGQVKKAFETLYTELKKVQFYGFTDSEFERAKAEMLRKVQSRFDNRNDIRSRDLVGVYISHYKNNTPAPSPEIEFKTDTALINALSVVGINKNAKWLISDRNQVVIITAPEKDGQNVPTKEDIAGIIKKVQETKPESYTDNSVRTPLVKNKLNGGKVKKTETDHFGATIWYLNNGVKVIVKKTDFKADEVIFSASANGGLAPFTNSERESGKLVTALVKMSGLGEFSAIDISKQLAGTDVVVAPFINEYNHGLSGDASPKDIETLLQLVYLYYTSPRFKQSDYNMMIEKYVSALSNAAENPKSIFQDSLINTIYGHNLRRQMITADCVRNMDFATMQLVYKRLFGNARDFTFTFVGNIDLSSFKLLVEKYIGSLPVSKDKMGSHDDGIRIVNGEVTNRFKVQMKTPMTTVHYQYSGDIEYTPENVIVMNVFSQLLQMCYMKSIREEKSGSYSVSAKGAIADIPEDKYSLAITFNTAPESADELMAIIPAEIHKIAENGPVEAQLSKIKEFLYKQYPDELKYNNTWLMFLNRYHLKGIDFHKDQIRLIEEVDKNKIQQLAIKILKDNNLTKVIMNPL